MGGEESSDYKSLYDENLGVYTINSIEDWRIFYDSLQEQKYRDETVILTQDLILTEPLKQKYQNSFQGDFDGLGHEVTLKGTDVVMFEDIGMGTIRNLNLNLDVTVKDLNGYGPLAYRACESKIEGIKVKGKITVDPLNSGSRGGKNYACATIGQYRSLRNYYSTYSDMAVEVDFVMKGDEAAYKSSDKTFECRMIPPRDESNSYGTLIVKNSYFSGSFKDVYNKNTEGSDAYAENALTGDDTEQKYLNLTNVFYNSTLAPNVSARVAESGIIAKTDSEMKNSATYENWDKTRWVIQDGELPILKLPDSDLTELKAAIEKAEALKKEDYTESSWKKLETELDVAKKLTEKDNSYKIKGYVNTINRIIENELIEKKLDKTQLKDTIDRVSKLKDYHYTWDSWNAVKKLLIEAKKVYEGEYNQATINKINDDLKVAESKLVTLKSLLKADIDKGKAITSEADYETKYADYSKKRLEANLAEMEKYYNDTEDNLTEDIQKSLHKEFEEASKSMDSVPSLSKNAKGEYTISSAEDMKIFSDDVFKNGCKYTSQKIIFTKDVDMKGVTLGKNVLRAGAQGGAKCIIDGRGHWIKNFTDSSSAILPSDTATKVMNLNFDVKMDVAMRDPNPWAGYSYAPLQGDFSKCTMTGDVSITPSPRGQLYLMYGKAENCYSRVNFSFAKGANSWAQIYHIGNSPAGTSSNCYYAGEFNPEDKNIKLNIFSTGAKNYYDKVKAAGTVVSRASNGVITEQMKQQATYAGWNFDKIWKIDEKENDGYPILTQKNVISLVVLPVIEPKQYDKNDPNNKTAKVKDVVISSSYSDEEYALIKKYNARVDYKVKSAEFENSIGAGKVNVEFDYIKIVSDENSEVVFDVKRIRQPYGSIIDPEQSKINKDSLTDSGHSKVGNMNLLGIYDAKTPRTAAEFKKKWEFNVPFDPNNPENNGNVGFENYVGTPVVAGDYTFTYCYNRIHKIDNRTGKTVAEVPFNAEANPYLIYPIVGNGVLYVPGKVYLEDQYVNGYIAYDTETLEQMYIVPSGRLTIYQGKVYGDYQNPNKKNDYTYFVEYDMKDKNPKSMYEIIEPARRFTDIKKQANYPIMSGDYAFFPGGFALNLKTGVSKEFPIGVSGTAINYYEKNSRIYLTSGRSAENVLISYVFDTKTGTIDPSTRLSYSSTGEAGSNSVPVIYNDRVYLCGGGHFMGGGIPFAVVDANTLEECYTIPELNSKATVALTTAYATKENNQTVYLYVVPYAPQVIDNDPYNKKGVMYIIKDSQGQTKPEFEVIEAGYPQYCSQSVAISKDGDLIWYNDSKYAYCYNRSDYADAGYTAEDVIRQIDKLPNIDEYEFYNKYELKRIKQRYDELSSAEKAKVTNIKKLNDIISLENADPASRVKDGIESLPDISKVTLEHFNKATALKNAYNKLSADNQKKVDNIDKLNKIIDKLNYLSEQQKVQTLITDIGKLPEVKDITTNDKTTVESLITRYKELPEKLKPQIINHEKLVKASKRIEEIEKLIAKMEVEIKDTFEGQKVTLEFKDTIKKIDNQLSGLSDVDKGKITAIEQYLSPAKVDIVNMLIKNLEGKTVTKENVKEIKALVDEVDYFYGGILEGDLKYVEGYDLVEKLKADIKALQNDGSQGESGQIGGQTGGNQGNNQGGSAGNTAQQNNSTSVKTGDTTEIATYLIMFIIFSISLACVFSWRKKWILREKE